MLQRHLCYHYTTRELNWWRIRYLKSSDILIASETTTQAVPSPVSWPTTLELNEAHQIQSLGYKPIYQWSKVGSEVRFNTESQVVRPAG